MSIASAIQTKQQQVAAAYTSCNNKGATLPLTQNLTNLATCIDSISSGGGGGKYQLLERIKDDSNNEIGTVSGFFTDANDVEYAVVCLDARYRATSLKYLSSYASEVITNLPVYVNLTLYETTETATFNTQKIVDFCTAKSLSSDVCSHCRSKSFTIDNITYYGQLPNVLELIDIFKNRVNINSLDNGSSYSSYLLQIDKDCWASMQYDAYSVWCMGSGGNVKTNTVVSRAWVIPVLEIPNS